MEEEKYENKTRWEKLKAFNSAPSSETFPELPEMITYFRLVLGACYGISLASQHRVIERASSRLRFAFSTFQFDASAIERAVEREYREQGRGNGSKAQSYRQGFHRPRDILDKQRDRREKKCCLTVFLIDWQPREF
eukprot:scaffold86008_cov54-Attheya_sp.AAC.4